METEQDVLPTPTADTKQDASSGEQATFTQAQLDNIIAERVKRAKTSAQSEVLQSLGVKDVDEASALVTAAREAHNASLSELERANAELTTLRTKLSTAESEAESQRVALTHERVRHALSSALTSANVVDVEAAVTLATTGGLASFVGEDGQVNKVAVSQVVEDMKASKSYLFAAPVTASTKGYTGTKSNKDPVASATSRADAAKAYLDENIMRG